MSLLKAGAFAMGAWAAACALWAPPQSQLTGALAAGAAVIAGAGAAGYCVLVRCGGGGSVRDGSAVELIANEHEPALVVAMS